MSSLKYIFVIEGNALIRKPVEENNEAATEEKGIEATFTVAESIVSPSERAKADKPKPRNKRDQTSRGEL